jgi:hypothetical protein
MTFADWNHALLLSSALLVMGAMMLVTAMAQRERWIAVGVLVQGIALLFVANGSFYLQSELLLGAVALMVVSVLRWPLRSESISDADNSGIEDATSPMICPVQTICNLNENES